MRKETTLGCCSTTSLGLRCTKVRPCGIFGLWDCDKSPFWSVAFGEASCRNVMDLKDRAALCDDTLQPVGDMLPRVPNEVEMSSIATLRRRHSSHLALLCCTSTDST
ncbi:hypothetical protein IF2G_01319 [Cordyceps javanica]|nr:hypothetical protein IF2G_01319 [Cordyceps javanica]